MIVGWTSLVEPSSALSNFSNLCLFVLFWLTICRVVLNFFFLSSDTLNTRMVFCYNPQDMDCQLKIFDPKNTDY